MPPERLALMLSTLAFLAAFAVAIFRLTSGPWRSNWGYGGLMAVGFFCQCWVLSIRGEVLHRCPITTPWEVLVFISWGTVLAYWIIGSAHRLSLMGLFTAPLVWVFQMVALVLQGQEQPPPSHAALTGAPLDIWLEWHATMSLLSYALFALAATAGVMYLIQDRQLKRKKLGRIFFHMPPLKNLGKSVLRLLTAGFVLLTVGVATAYLMEKQPSGPKLAVAWVVWGTYLTVIGLILFRHWSGTRVAWAAALTFVLPLISLAVVSGR